MRYGDWELSGSEAGNVGVTLPPMETWANPMLPVQFQFTEPEPRSLRSALLQKRLNGCGAFEATFTLGPVDDPVLPDCGPWNLAVLGAVLEAQPKKPVLTLWDGGWNRQVWWRGRRYHGTVGELFLDIYEGHMS